MTARAANLEALSDLRTPWCLRVVVTLGIAEHISAGVSHVNDLAAASGCDADSLHTVLAHLASRGVFDEVAPGEFALNGAAKGLRDPGTRLGLDLEGIGGRMAYGWGTLLSAVRTGSCAYREAFGLSFWEDLEAHPEVAASFDALMGPAGHGIPNPEILPSRDWHGVRLVVDVGGGTGAMLAEILKAHPGMQGVLVDLPATAARSREVFEAAGVAGRVRAIGQSFFDPLPAGGDLYILKGVLNDWPDDEATLILRRCAEAVLPEGRIVVSGGVALDDAPRRLGPDMVVAAGLRHRTLSRFRDMTREVGLEVVAAGQAASGGFVVECRRT